MGAAPVGQETEPIILISSRESVLELCSGRAGLRNVVQLVGPYFPPTADRESREPDPAVIRPFITVVWLTRLAAGPPGPPAGWWLGRSWV